MIVLGLLLGIVGTDVNSGMSRFTFGSPGLSDGIGFVMVVMGVFGLAELITNLEQGSGSRDLLFQKIRKLWPTREDFRRSWKPVLRGIGLGSFFGPLPGTGPTSSAFSSYPLEKKLADDPSLFGKGAVEGVAGGGRQQRRRADFVHPHPHARHSRQRDYGAHAGRAHDLGHRSGPQVMTQRPDLFWGLIASMWIGNLFPVCSTSR